MDAAALGDRSAQALNLLAAFTLQKARVQMIAIHGAQAIADELRASAEVLIVLHDSQVSWPFKLDRAQLERLRDEATAERAAASDELAKLCVDILKSTGIAY